MKKNLLGVITKYIFLFILLLTEALYSQSHTEVKSIASMQAPSHFAREGDIFGKRNFIENKGQFSLPGGGKVLFIYEYQGEKVYFTTDGVVYEINKPATLTHEQQEAIEHGEKMPADDTPPELVRMTWVNSQTPVVEGKEKPGHYFTYGSSDINAYAYRKIVYKNIYQNTDIEYTIPNNKEKGIKYSLILHPGADLTQVKMFYSGDFKSMSLNSGGDLILKTREDPIIDHAPVSFYENGDTITSLFKLLKKDTVVFSLPFGYDKNKRLIIDPWVTAVTTLSSSNSAYDVDYDFGGNTFVYGGTNTFQIAMYNSSGSHQWTFSGLLTNPSWNANLCASNFGIDKFTGKSFTGQGVVGTGAQVVRLDNSGNYDNFISNANSNYREIWELGFHCTTADVFIFGGSTAGNLSAATISSVNANLNVTAFQANTSCCQDVVSYAIDDVGDIYILYASGTGTIGNKLCLVNSTFNGNIWTMPTGYSSMNENGNKTAYQPSTISNGFNCLAVNGNYLFYYDGLNLAAYSKLSGSPVASISISGMTLKRQGGIAVDDCNNLYLGGNGSILTYNFNGTAFSTLTPISLGINTATQNVHDIKFERNTNVLYVCGTGFVGVYSAAISGTCPIPQGVCLFNQAGLGASTTSITCATLGSASVTLNGGIGPYTYTWVPSGVTGSVNTNLNPGTYTVIVYDSGNGKTYTTTVSFVSPVPLTGTVMPVFLDCFGVNNATAAVQNLAGGSSTQTYLWKSSTATQTTSIATGLAPGPHTVTVTDALTFCAFTRTFMVTSPPALTLNVFVNTPSVCAGKFITLTPFIAGGTIGGNGYSYSWTPFSSTPVHQATQQLGGNYNYTLTAYDAKMCPITRTVPLTFFPTPTLSVSDVSICPGQVATFNVSGANTYSWNTISGTTSYTVSPPSTTIYTVSGTGTLCSSTKTIVAVVLPVPVPTITSNSPLCNGKTLQLNAAGGVSVLWTGPQAFSSTLFQSSITQAASSNSGVYNATVTAANTCTAAGSVNVLVNATPAVSALGATVCVNSVLQLSGSGPAGCVYAWTGPSGFISSVQNPSISNVQLSANGTYTLKITDANTCTNSIALLANVVNKPIVSFSFNAPICAGKTLQFNAGATTGALQYNWSGPNGFISSVQNPIINNVSAVAGGVYGLQAVNGPCTVSSTKYVQVNPLPVLTLLSQLEVCEGKTISLNPVTSQGIVSTSWTGPGGFSSGLPVHTLFPAEQKHAGNYNLKITDVNGCETYSTVTVSVKINPVITVDNVTVCFKEPAFLNAQGAAAYFWQGPNLENNSGPSVRVLTANSSSLVIYTVTGIAGNQCSASNTLALFTIPIPVPKFLVFPSTKLCLNNRVTFEGDGGLDYEWRGPENIFYKGKTVSFDLIYSGYAGTYTLTVSDANNCKASTEQVIEINALPVGKLTGSKMKGCVPFCSDFLFTSPSQSVTVRWLINQKIYPESAFNYCFTKPGDVSLYGFLYDSTTACSNTIQSVVNVYRNPVADFTFASQHPVENTDVVIFTANAGDQDITRFQWTFVSNDGFSSRYPVTSLLFETEGIYGVALEVENKWGCKDTVVKSITIEPDFLVFVPNAFTPNADELNDQFKPVTRAVKQYQLSIFDRWGELLYKSTDLNAGWDGTYKGEACQTDVYAWIINLAALNGETKELKGHVTLQR